MRSPPSRVSERFAITTCTSKAVYQSRREAQAVNPNQRPYLCPLCGKWHLTKRKPR